jgi:hypothetical protein
MTTIKQNDKDEKNRNRRTDLNNTNNSGYGTI